MDLKIKKITKENFFIYGDLITTKNKNGENINADTTQSYFDLANIEILGQDHRTRLNIFKAKKRIFPLKIDMLENHPFSSQVFLPLDKTNFIALVAPISRKPDLNKLECFIISDGDGVNFKTKVWHFPLISTEDAEFITIDKKDAETNIDIYNFDLIEQFNLKYE